MKQYLGDGVYIEIDDFGDVILTTENGLRETNRIVLEPEVLQHLLNYLTEAQKRYSEQVNYGPE